MRSLVGLFFVQHEDLFADDFGHISLDPLLVFVSTGFVFAFYVHRTAFA